MGVTAGTDPLPLPPAPHSLRGANTLVASIFPPSSPPHLPSLGLEGGVARENGYIESVEGVVGCKAVRDVGGRIGDVL